MESQTFLDPDFCPNTALIRVFSFWETPTSDGYAHCTVPACMSSQPCGISFHAVCESSWPGRDIVAWLLTVRSPPAGLPFHIRLPNCELTRDGTTGLPRSCECSELDKWTPSSMWTSQPRSWNSIQDLDVLLLEQRTSARRSLIGTSAARLTQYPLPPSTGVQRHEGMGRTADLRANFAGMPYSMIRYKRCWPILSESLQYSTLSEWSS